MPGTIRIGTSGWHYTHWRGPFYREDTPAAEFLRSYAPHFTTVEINSTFYRLPAEKALVEWRDSVPADFLFAVKASRYITHMKKLKDPAETASGFLQAIQPLGAKRGPVLFQLPPRWHVNIFRLEAFLEALPAGVRFAFEFRDETWYRVEVYDLLARHNAALCIFDLNRRRSPLRLTADFAYVRLHGPEGPYQGSYDGRALSAWARRFQAWARSGLDVYCYFDNDEKGYAPRDAARLLKMINRR